jgi:YrbI family 3-deoxy-D-manno-octulosonate 8-phosphate phosphatase
VPGKNLARVGGRRLIERAVDACRAARLIDAVYVSTDDPDIAAAAEGAGAQVVPRPARLAGDGASSESALLHALEELATAGTEPEVLVFVQCTSPFISPDDLDRGIEMVTSDRADSAFSAVATHEFLWRSQHGSVVTGVNHDPVFRPRRQDRRPDYRETGAFYVLAVPRFTITRHRFFGRTAAVDVPALTAVDVDSEQDLLLAEALAGGSSPLAVGFQERQRREPIGGRGGSSSLTTVIDVDAVITDFDGVHTDDSVVVDQNGNESVRVSRSDGLGIERLRASGVPLLIVSKERNPVVLARAAKLGVEVIAGVDGKAAVVRDWLAGRGVPTARAAYLGNDVNDLDPMRLVGWPVAVADAHPAVRQGARLTLTRAGGHGAVRELCDLVLQRRHSGE